MAIININYESAKKSASELSDTLQNMIKLLDELEEKVNRMKWSGSSADRFKKSITNAKDELDNIYKNQILPIPSKIEDSVKKYQMYEN